MATEVACVCYVGTINQLMQVLIRYMALSSIAKVDNIYANSLPEENRIMSEGSGKPLEIKNYRRNLTGRCEKYNYGCGLKFGRFIFKSLRMVYASYIFYFFPYTTLVVTYIAEWYRQSQP